MDLLRLNELLRDFAQEQIFPEKKLKDQLYQLILPERVDYLRHLQFEFKQGIFDAVFDGIEQRYENEEPPSYLDYSDKQLTPRETFFRHLQDRSEQYKTIFNILIPDLLRDYGREIKSIIDRQEITDKYGIGAMVNPTEEEMLSVEEAAKFLGKKVSTIYSYTSKERQILIPYTYGRNLLIPKSQLITLLKKK